MTTTSMTFEEDKQMDNGRNEEPEVARDSLSFRVFDDGSGSGSFLLYNDSPQIISAAAPRIIHWETIEDGDGDDDAGDDSDDGIEFAFTIDKPEYGFPVDGRILPVYPVFGRRLLRPGDGNGDEAVEDEEDGVRSRFQGLSLKEPEETNTNPCAEADAAAIAAAAEWESDWEDVGKLDGIPPETYCIWTPGASPRSPGRCPKSSSTGSTIRWRLRDLVCRSHSDGKEKFLFLAAPEKKPKEKAKQEKDKKPSAAAAAAAAVGAEKKKKNAKKETEDRGRVTDVGTSRQNMYGKTGKPAAGAGRQSFLPYRQEIIGIFAGVNGFSRTYKPY